MVESLKKYLKNFQLFPVKKTQTNKKNSYTITSMNIYNYKLYKGKCKRKCYITVYMAASYVYFETENEKCNCRKLYLQ